MRAITYSRTGPPEVLTLVDKPLAAPGPGEVRVQLHRSGINPTDWKGRLGTGNGAEVTPPQVPHHDGAGVVDAVGEGVEQAWHGLRVWVWEAAHGRPEGTAQEYALVPAHQVVALPELASYDVGASLGIPFRTAHRCLTVNDQGPTRLGPGTLQDRVVLVAGGAGAVGNATIQLARWSDATVVATVSSPEKARLAALAGADHVIDYKREDVVTEVRKIAPRGVQTVVEVAAATNAAIDTEVLGRDGVVAVYAASPGETVQFPIRDSMVNNLRWQFLLVYTAPHKWKLQAVEDISAAVLDRAVGVGAKHGLPIHHYSLAETAKAHRAVEEGAVGKVLLAVVE